MIQRGLKKLIIDTYPVIFARKRPQYGYILLFVAKNNATMDAITTRAEVEARSYLGFKNRNEDRDYMALPIDKLKFYLDKTRLEFGIETDVMEILGGINE